MENIFNVVLKDGYRGAIILFLCILSYKLFKCKQKSDLSSDCCDGFHFSQQTENNGGDVTFTTEHINENNNNTDNNV